MSSKQFELFNAEVTKTGFNLICYRKFSDHKVVHQPEEEPATCNYQAPDTSQGNYEIRDFSIILL
jgi:hypothetical protein